MNRSAIAPAVPAASPLANYYRWAEPDSEITACLNLETIDRLQAAVLRALPRFSQAGQEVGGILLGKRLVEDDRTVIVVEDFEAIPCERRKGTGYVLSGKDELRLEASLKRHTGGAALSTVGYFRSHNRDGLCLSAHDLRLIERHFRGPENVFLLIKTLPSGACTAGFFFWKDGRIQSEFTDSEVPLMPVSLELVEPTGELPSASPVEAPKAHLNLRRLVRPIAITGVAAALTVGVVRYETAAPSNEQTRQTARTIPALPAPAPAPAHEVPLVAASSAAATPPSPVETHGSPAPVSPPINPKPAASAPAKYAPPVAPPGGTRVSPKHTALSAELPPEVAPANPSVTPVALPAPPVTAPAMPAAPPTRPAPVVLETAPPASIPAPARVFTGARVIHEATPAIPRGVAHMITSDVEVDVTVTIDEGGRVTAARVASTKGAAAGLLTIEALKAAQLFRFQPAKDHDRNVTSSMVLTFRFANKSK